MNGFQNQIQNAFYAIEKAKQLNSKVGRLS